jgi:EmrB/QacA subfamily drug resistance transporter
MFMGALDQTIMSTAAPRIVADLGGFDLLSWVFTSYMLSSTVVVPLVGKLSDIYGRKLFLLCGIVLFLAASAGCGAAPSMHALIAFRAVQGVGGGIIFASVFSAIGDMFPPSERGKYIGLFTGTFSLASVLGPTFGGLLTDHVGWRWVFYINVPVGAVALPAIWYNMPFHSGARRPRIDFLGAALLSGATVSLLLGLAWAGEQYGWTANLTLGLFAIGAVFALLFVTQELRHPEPIIPFHLFRNREFLLGNLIVFTIGIAMMGTIPYLPTFVQTAMDASATASGLITTPQSLGVLVTSIIGGQFLSRTGRYRMITVAGAVLMLVATALMLTLGPGASQWHVSVFMVILGLGSGLSMPTMSVVVQNAVPHQFLGVATSSRQFFMQIGGVLGTAIFGVVLASTFQAQFNDNLSSEARAVIPPAAAARFEDPTLALDETRYAEVQAEVLALPGGEAALREAQQSQKDAITTALHRIFTAASAIVVVTVLLALLLKEVPLRRAFGDTPSAGDGATREPPVPAPALDMH